MNKETIHSLIQASDAVMGSEERINFKNLWQASAELCRPLANTVLGARSPGEQKSTARLIDIGINCLNTFTACITSTLTPKGSKFITYQLRSTERVPDDHRPGR